MRIARRVSGVVGVLAVAAGLGGLSGCGLVPGIGEGVPGGPGAVTATGSADDVALDLRTVSAWPNFRVPGAPTFPELVVHGDGSFVASRWVAGDDGLSEVRYRAGTLSPAALDDLLEQAAVLLDRDYGEPGLDGSSTTLRLGAGSGMARPRDVDVWVPQAVEGYEGEARASREAFLDFLDEVERTTEDAGREWEPPRWFLLGDEPYQAEDDAAPPRWPLADLDPVGEHANPDAGFGCQVIDAADARRVEAAQQAAEERRQASGAGQGWRFDGAVVDVLVLPALPGVGCEDLEDYRYPVV